MRDGAGRRDYRVAVDIGGTFTDLVAVDAGSERLVLGKVPTTPGRLEDGVLEALKRSGMDLPAVETFVHGTTVVVNAITERRGARTALVTTRGFRDVLEIGRANRPDLYNLSYRKPPPFVPRRWRFEVRERVSHRGEVIEPLVEEDVHALVPILAEIEAEAVAVCFLHAWANPEHEQRASELLSKHLPGVEVVASHEASGQWREYERSSTAVFAAYVKPVVAGYLHALRQRLREGGATPRLYTFRSSGGVCSFDRAVRAPITLLESGPVAGVTAAAELGRRLGVDDILALDVGGTTAKTSAIQGGQVRVETLHHIEQTPASAGYPVQVPVAEIVEIGAGGGSIAWADEAGGLHLGPRSAGAEPGPACYGRGGREPTLTDANLVAGRLDPEYFLGGQMRLDPEAAEAVLARLGERLGVDPAAAARGVLRYAVAQMANTLRLVTVRRGRDPRDFTFVAFGGAGPLHAPLLARELGVRRTVVPPAPGHFSALGMLLGDLRADAIRTHVGPLEPEPLARLFERLEREAATELADEAESRTVQRFAQLRYVGQEHTLEVPLPGGAIDAGLLQELRARFDLSSEETYAFSLTTPVEMVEARVSVSVPAGLSGWSLESAGRPLELRPRLVDFDEYGGRQTCAVVERSGFDEGDVLRGPCIVEEPATTTLVLPGQMARRDELGNLVVEEAS